MQPDNNPNDNIQIHDLHFIPLLSEEQVQKRVQELGAALTERYAGQNPLFISILSGAFVFASDLIRAFKDNCEVGFVKLASYTGTRSSGSIQTVMGIEKNLRVRHVFVVEDIIDTGLTLSHLLQVWQTRKPKAMKVCRAMGM